MDALLGRYEAAGIFPTVIHCEPPTEPPTDAQE
jgi:hypothetical protein